MNTWICILVVLVIIYLFYYYVYKSEVRNDNTTYEYYMNVINNNADPYLPVLNTNNFTKINDQLNRDALDLMIFNKLKKRRSTLYSSLGLRESLLPCYLGSTVGSNLWSMFKGMFKMDDKLLLSFHRDLNKYLLQTGKLQIANSIWYNNYVKLNPFFQKQISCLTQSNTPIVQQDIDDWVTVQTRG